MGGDGAGPPQEDWSPCQGREQGPGDSSAVSERAGWGGVFRQFMECGQLPDQMFRKSPRGDQRRGFGGGCNRLQSGDQEAAGPHRIAEEEDTELSDGSGLGEASLIYEHANIEALVKPKVGEYDSDDAGIV